jgi:hypothetical protein
MLIGGGNCRHGLGAKSIQAFTSGEPAGDAVAFILSKTT